MMKALANQIASRTTSAAPGVRDRAEIASPRPIQISV